MSEANLPRWYHDVIGVAFVVSDEGTLAQEAFRYPWYSENPSDGPLGMFDRIPPDTLAKLTRAHQALSGELLEVVFDDVRLITRPVFMTPEREDSSRTATFYNLIFAVASECRPPRLHYSSAYPKLPTRFKMPSAAATAAAMDGPGAADNLRDFPAFIEVGEMASELDGGGNEWGAEERGPGVDLSLLRGALMMASRALYHEEYSRGFISRSGRELLQKKERHASEVGKAVAKKVSDSGFVHLAPKEFSSRQHKIFGGHVDLTDEQSVADIQNVAEECWRRDVFTDCDLANDMRKLFNGLTSGSPLEMTINGWSGLSINVKVQRPIPEVRRYETLLLRNEKHIVQAEEPPDASPQIRALIDMEDPHKTFDELAYANEIDLPQMFRLARHMVFWGDGRVIDALCVTNRYTFTRAARRAWAPNSEVGMEFAAKFPKRHLLKDLMCFGEGRPLSDVLDGTRKSHHESLVAVLLFFLRRDLLAQLQRYIALTVIEPPALVAERSRANGASELQKERQHQPHQHQHHHHHQHYLEEGKPKGTSGLVSSDSSKRPSGGAEEPARREGSPGGRDAALAVDGWGSFYGCASAGYGAANSGRKWFGLPTLKLYEEEYFQSRDDGSETSKLMRRLAPFFRGKLHLREIVWRLEIDDLQAVEHTLKVYGDVLIDNWRTPNDPHPDYDV